MASDEAALLLLLLLLRCEAQSPLQRSRDGMSTEGQLSLQYTMQYYITTGFQILHLGSPCV